MPSLSGTTLLIAFATLALASCSPADSGGVTTGGAPNKGGGTGTGAAGSTGQAAGSGNVATGGTTGPGILLPTSTCGDGVLDEVEDCDDGNADSGDGCTAVCQQEADFDCSVPGELCVYNAICGNGILNSLEVCDDGNDVGEDGCAADCLSVDSGWQCRVVGKPCVPFCGDLQLVGYENCDDGGNENGDGCSATCLTEPGWSCELGVACVESQCGNGAKEAGETCDQGAYNGVFFGDGTGCSKTCTVEPSCRDATTGETVACATVCGDGNIEPGETCDDGNLFDGDGCSSTCEDEDGFDCTTETRPDVQPCSNGTGDCLVLPILLRDFDGQQVAASGHPDFFYMTAPVDGETTVCVPNASGVGVATLDGNCANSDSTPLCSGLVEPTLNAEGKPAYNATTGGTCACRFTDWDQTGIIDAVAGSELCTEPGEGTTRRRIETTTTVIHSAESFAQWYTDSDLSDSYLTTLELPRLGTSEQFQFSSSGGLTVYDDLHNIFLGTQTSLTSGFFPLDDQERTKVCNIWPYWLPALQTAAGCRAAEGSVPGSQWDFRGWYGEPANPPAVVTGGPVAPVVGMMRNFYFTSEARYYFRYVGGEELSFFGDDDVWVFINGRLVLDLGATHERLQGDVTLTGGEASWTISAQDVVTLGSIPVATGTVAGLGLEVDRTYEIAVFHADRHPRESNYQLTLSGFSTNQSVCQPSCGDGVVASGEECDDGEGVNDDFAYGGCTTQCKYGPFCGDGVVSEEGAEECDLGIENGAGYGDPSGCTGACTTPHYCGDGTIESAVGEECDNGPGNGSGGCTSDCKLIIT